MRDHETCDDAIAEALRKGYPGKAEFLAARCDDKHGRYSTHPASSRAASNTESASAPEEDR